jgi:glycosyltransferase involved in cell wall biosynthesis
MMMAVAFKGKAKLLFDIRGFWVDERIDGNIWDLHNPLYKFIYKYFKKKEKKLFAEADGIISLSSAACPIIRSWQPIKNPAPITVIPCCTDFTLFDPNTIERSTTIRLRKSLDIPSESFVLGYIGGISTWYMPAEMFGFFNALLDLRPDAYFLIITQEDKEQLIYLAQSNNVPLHKIRVTRTDRKNTPEYLSVFDASVFFIKQAFSKQASSPTKMGELMCMDIPMVSNTGVGDTAEMIRDTGSGAVISNFNQEAYKEAAITLLKVFNSKKPGRIRKEGIKLFGLPQGGKKYMEMYHHLLNQE